MSYGCSMCSIAFLDLETIIWNQTSFFYRACHSRYSPFSVEGGHLGFLGISRDPYIGQLGNPPNPNPHIILHLTANFHAFDRGALWIYILFIFLIFFTAKTGFFELWLTTQFIIVWFLKGGNIEYRYRPVKSIKIGS
jgi:hypothetical protein